MNVLTKHSVAVMGWTLWDGCGKTPSGAAMVTYELTKRLSQYFDCDMIFETSDRSKAGSIEQTGEGFRRRFILRSKGLWHLDEEFLGDYDLIHIWDASPVYTYRAFTQTFLPHCYTLHSAASMAGWAPLASAFYVPEHDIVTLGSRCLARALKRFWRFPVDVIPYGVDTEVFKPLDKNECKRELKIPKERFVLGYLGRLSKFNPIFAYETMRKVKEQTGRVDIMLVVAGGSRKIKPVYVKDDFLLLGYLEPSQVPLFLNSCDVFFNPVAGMREGFGLTVVEAMSCGLPVVTSSWNGYRETVSCDAGFLARTCWVNGDVWINQRDLVSACVTLVKNPDLREKMAKKARQRVERCYTWDRCVDNYRLKFEEMIRKGTPKNLPYERAPDEITVETTGVTRITSLEEMLRKTEEFKVDFQALHEGFVSDLSTQGEGWKRFTCIDNIVNLPKYRMNMKRALVKLGNQIAARFPKLARALETS